MAPLMPPRCRYEFTSKARSLCAPRSIGSGMLPVASEARMRKNASGLRFASGANPGLVVKFAFDTNRSAGSHFVVDRCGSALAAEGAL